MKPELILLTVILMMSSYAQDEPFFYIGNQESFYIAKGTFLAVNGSLKVNESGNRQSILGGNLVVLGDSVSASKPTVFFNTKKSAGSLVLYGNKTQHIKNIDSLNNLQLLSRPTGQRAILHSNLHLYDSLVIQNKSLEMNDGVKLHLGLANVINQNPSTIVGETDLNPIVLGQNCEILTHQGFNTSSNFGNLGLSVFLKERGGSAIDLMLARNADVIDSVTDGSVRRVYVLTKNMNANQVLFDSLVFDYHSTLENPHNMTEKLLIWVSEDGEVWEKPGETIQRNEGRFVLKNLLMKKEKLWITLAPGICQKKPYQVAIAPDSVDFCESSTISFSKDIHSVYHLWNNQLTIDELVLDSSMKVIYVGSNKRGCEAIDSFSVHKREKPKSDFEVNHDVAVCEGDSIKLMVSIPDEHNTYIWKTSTSNLNAEGFKFAYVVNFFDNNEPSENIELEVNNQYGCVSNSAKTLTLIPKPEVSFTGSLVCGDSAIRLLNTSPDLGMNFSWQLGDGRVFETSGLAAQPPIYHYPDSGTYEVRLTGTKMGGCQNETVKMLHFPTPNSKGCERGGNNGNGGNVSRLPACKLVSPESIKPRFLVASNAYSGDTLVFVQLSEPPADKHIWLLSDGRFDTLSRQPEIPFLFSSAAQRVTMISVYPNCADTLAKTFNINPRPPGRLEGRPRRVFPEISLEPAGDEPIFYELVAVKLMPNPVTDRLKIVIEKPTEAKVISEWRDAYGSLVMVEEFREETSFWDVSTLKAGVYFISIKLGFQHKVLRFVKM
ncbi:MAG: T9SS type A sorting domain-containing protein [Cytophagales bacterium]